MRPRQWPVEQVFVYREPCDMRKSIDGLAALVELEMELSPFQPALFVFCNRQRDKVKLLYWESNGFVLWYKRLEKQRFKWPKQLSELTGQQLSWLLDGIDIERLTPHSPLNFNTVMSPV
jgi:transposase